MEIGVVLLLPTFTVPKLPFDDVTSETRLPRLLLEAFA
jgi:hypothetical protein